MNKLQEQQTMTPLALGNEPTFINNLESDQLSCEASEKQSMKSTKILAKAVRSKSQINSSKAFRIQSPSLAAREQTLARDLDGFSQFRIIKYSNRSRARKFSYSKFMEKKQDLKNTEIKQKRVSTKDSLSSMRENKIQDSPCIRANKLRFKLKKVHKPFKFFTPKMKRSKEWKVFKVIKRSKTQFSPTPAQTRPEKPRENMVSLMKYCNFMDTEVINY